MLRWITRQCLHLPHWRVELKCETAKTNSCSVRSRGSPTKKCRDSAWEHFVVLCVQYEHATNAAMISIAKFAKRTSRVCVRIVHCQHTCMHTLCAKSKACLLVRKKKHHQTSCSIGQRHLVWTLRLCCWCEPGHRRGRGSIDNACKGLARNLLTQYKTTKK